MPAWQDNAAAVAEALFATPDGAPPEARVAWLIDDLEHFLGKVGGRSRLVFDVSLGAVTRLGPLTVLSMRPFATLPLALRVRALSRLEHGPASLALFAVKTLLCFIWYEHPDSQVEAGLVRNVHALPRRARGLS